jgi:hypothetical protein
VQLARRFAPSEAVTANRSTGILIGIALRNRVPIGAKVQLAGMHEARTKRVHEHESRNLLMSVLGDPALSGTNGDDSAQGVATQLPIAVHSCNRLGRVANPPGFSLTAWFRSSRRR